MSAAASAAKPADLVLDGKKLELVSVLLDDQNLCALICGHRRRYESGATGPNDDDIDDLIPVGS